MQKISILITTAALFAFGAGCVSTKPSPLPPAARPPVSQSLPTTQPNTVTLKQTQAVPMPMLDLSAVSWKTYQDAARGFSIDYPVVNPTDAMVLGQGYDLSSFPKHFSGGPNDLRQRFFFIHSDVADSAKACVPMNSANAETKTAVINGVTFCVQFESDCGAGNCGRTWKYTAQNGSKAVSISFNDYGVDSTKVYESCEPVQREPAYCLGFIAEDTKIFEEMVKRFKWL